MTIRSTAGESSVEKAASGILAIPVALALSAWLPNRHTEGVRI